MRRGAHESRGPSLYPIGSRRPSLIARSMKAAGTARAVVDLEFANE